MIDREKIIEEIIESFRVLLRKIMAEGKRGLEKCPLTPTQAQLLFIINCRQNISVKELAEKLAISSSAVAQMVEDLVENGYLVRTNHPKDHRFVQLNLSEKARAQIKQFKAAFIKKVATLFEGLSDNELIEYHYLSKRILKKR
jgi:DNA-binding MarR family transcriptional regulator